MRWEYASEICFGNIQLRICFGNVFRKYALEICSGSLLSDKERPYEHIHFANKKHYSFLPFQDELALDDLDLASQRINVWR